MALRDLTKLIMQSDSPADAVVKRKLLSDREAAQAAGDVEKRNAEARARNAGVPIDDFMAGYKKQSDADLATYGTDVASQVDAVRDRGPFRKDFKEFAQVDPEGAQREVQQVKGSLGLGGAPAPGAGFREGVQTLDDGRQIPYFTNLSQPSVSGVSDLHPMNTGDGVVRPDAGPTTPLGHVAARINVAEKELGGGATAVAAKEAEKYIPRLKAKAAKFGMDAVPQFLTGLMASGKLSADSAKLAHSAVAADKDNRDAANTIRLTRQVEDRANEVGGEVALRELDDILLDPKRSKTIDPSSVFAAKKLLEHRIVPRLSDQFRRQEHGIGAPGHYIPAEPPTNKQAPGGLPTTSPVDQAKTDAAEKVNDLASATDAMPNGPAPTTHDLATGKLGRFSEPVGEAARIGLPILGELLGGLAGVGGAGVGAVPAAAAGGAIGGAGGTMLADWLEGRSQHPEDIAANAALGALPAPGLKLAGKVGKAGARLAGAAARGAGLTAEAIPNAVRGLRAAPGVARAARYATEEMTGGVGRAAQAVDEAVGGIGRAAEVGEGARAAEGVGRFAKLSRPQNWMSKREVDDVLYGPLTGKEAVLRKLGINRSRIAKMTPAEVEESLKSLFGGAR